MDWGVRGDQFEEYWDWFAVSLFLLVPVDMLVTLGAASAPGPAVESNPVMRRLLAEGPVVLVGVNLLVVVLAAGAFAALIGRTRATPEPYDRYLRIALEAWLGCLLAVGFFVLANNLAVIVLGAPLL